MFSGSYEPGDVTFLLKPVEIAETPIAEKERLIQSGRRHYSEMITRESLPSPAYLRVFHEACDREKTRFARDLLMLANYIATDRTGEITLVSLARAGTPIGVLAARALRRMDRRVSHYSISIIRDRGIDTNALDHILNHHAADSLVFVDGWTGKGVIAHELAQAIAGYNAVRHTALDAGLYSVADLCGAAAVAATTDDYLIPSSVLGATVSGLVSRSILNDAVTGPGDFHGCLYYREFADQDLSRWFVDAMDQAMRQQNPPRTPRLTEEQKAVVRRTSERFLAGVMRRFGTRDVNHVKPGIGEATRVLLRRVPDRLLIRDVTLPEVAHLLLLAQEKIVRVEEDATLPYAAAAMIKELDG